MCPERYDDAQKNRTLVHPRLPQLKDDEAASTTVNLNAGEVGHCQVLTESHTFVVTADTQLGMSDQNRPEGDDWNAMAEIEYCRKAIQKINQLRPKPLFCCVCGDLVDMVSGVYAGSPKVRGESSSQKWTKNECDEVQDIQNAIFRELFADLDPDIALICLCGNHDVGNQPTAASLERFKCNYGDDYLAFWANGTYNIVLNSSLISRPFSACELYQDQLEWLEARLRYARHHQARNIFVFMHHPLFLYNEMEDESQLTGVMALPKGFGGLFVLDSYFPIPRERRKLVLELLEEHQVTACFAGHFHQNVVTKTTFGMEMIITGPLSVVMQSTGVTEHGQVLTETQGFRLARVQTNPNGGKGTLSHEYIPL